ncbi:Putative bactericidal permeability-increasing protein, alpha/beta domain superfamily [Colletotrichum destructivum]|uniref:Bactericidal permeability-increasing protein, alpha/beta domain superfamily n=1 Tax=Colletotrichum destructivum TaxID=34406 RepID=A0AAX4HWE9_9PEZI|nr:Putative bactericidal permeability-increasing protein, alpha/beta domain superfamily [Colletotrichum destructivum]
MLSCFGFGRPSREEREREPLLPRYNDDTALQQRLHEKLHTYQMLRAIGKGYMPSNEQLIINLRTLLSADILNPDTPDLSDAGRALVLNVKLLIKQLIELLLHKNDKDQIQDFVWYLTKARLSVDAYDIGARASKAKARADTVAAYKSLQTVGSLILTNKDFRLFLSDLSTVGREVFRDTAFTLSDVSRQAAKDVEPSKEDEEAIKHPNGDSKPPPSKAEIQGEAIDVSKVVTDGVARVADEAGHSLADHLTGEEQETLVSRLKKTVLNLRGRKDYSDSVSTLSLLIRRYLLIYSHAISDTIQVAQEDIDTNPEADRALHNFWLFLTSLGDREHWNEVERIFKVVMEHGRSDPEFDKLVRQIGNLLQDILTDPDFFEHAEDRFRELRAKSRELTSESSIRDDLDALLDRVHLALHSVLEDTDIKKVLHTTKRILKILSPASEYLNGELLADSTNIFIPLLIQAIQYIPIPRLEVSMPTIDLLLENLILEPGRTVNNSSFLPFKLNISTQNDVEIRKARFRTTTSVKTLMRITLSGLSIAAEDLGYWLRLHSGILRLADAGIAGFHLDERGIDVAIDVEVGKERLENMLTLHGVRVRIHHLDYSLRKSSLSWLAWLLKPLIRPTVKAALEAQIATGISEGLHFANREMLYARERLRATRIADPQDLWTFVKAVAARLVPPEDPDLYTRVGVTQPGRGVFKGVYAPGSLVKMWNEEATLAGDRVHEYQRDGWRNSIFDVGTTGVTI